MFIKIRFFKEEEEEEEEKEEEEEEEEERFIFVNPWIRIDLVEKNGYSQGC
jgi:hypothetical protein